MKPISFTPDHQKHKHHTLLLVVLALVVTAAIFLVIYRYVHRKQQPPVPPTPEQTLNALQNSSLPVTKSLDQRAADLSSLEKSSGKAAPRPSQQQQIDELNMLH